MVGGKGEQNMILNVQIKKKEMRKEDWGNSKA